MEPVCNLIDMPPFSGVDDNILSNALLGFYSSITNGNNDLILNYYTNLEMKDQCRSNANYIYCRALAEEKLKTNNPIEQFIKAKDLDTTPFRARSILVKNLKKYANNSPLKNLHYIPLFNELTNNYGINIMGNKIFIDQLHFNHYGQIVVSEILSKYIANLYHFDNGQISRIETFYTNQTQIDKNIQFLPLYSISAYLGIHTLILFEPFSMMLIPFIQPDFSSIDPNNPILKDKSLLVEINKYLMPLKKGEFSDVVLNNKVIDYYSKMADQTILYNYLQSYIFVNPGFYSSYDNMSTILDNSTNFNSNTTNNFIKAYLLSGKKLDLYEKMKNYLIKINREDLLLDINKQYGLP